MPNWCFNQVRITGTKKYLEDFAKQVKHKKTDLSFEKMIPTPPALLNQNGASAPMQALFQKPKNALDDDWYAWRVRNWGTKWDVEFSLEQKKQNSLLYVGDSAWAPPLAGLERLSAMFPHLSFTCEYEEPGMCFKGVWRAENGKVLEDSQSEYNPEDEE